MPINQGIHMVPCLKHLILKDFLMVYELKMALFRCVVSSLITVISKRHFVSFNILIRTFCPTHHLKYVIYFNPDLIICSFINPYYKLNLFYIKVNIYKIITLTSIYYRLPYTLGIASLIIYTCILTSKISN